MVMMEMPSWSKELVPFVAMVIVEFCEMGMATLGKAALNDGVSNLVYVVYHHTLVEGRSKTASPLWWGKKQHVSYYIAYFMEILPSWLFGVIRFTGIKYSSPTLSAALGNSTPGFTFLLAIIFRMEILDIRKTSSQAKCVGTIVAIIGASVMTLYKGPRILGSTLPSDSSNQFFLSQESNWVLGALLITATCITAAGWNILQTDTVKKYPEHLTIVFFYGFFGSIQSAILTLVFERNPDAWILKPGIGMIAIVFSAVCGSVVRCNVVTWCLDKKGPLYVAMFKPLGTVIAAIMGIIFLADTLHLGSVIGAAIISAGFYSVMWGKAKEKAMLEVEDFVCGSDSSNQRSPLLQK